MNMPRWAAGLFAAALMTSPCLAQTDGSDPRSAMGTHGLHTNGDARAQAAAAAAMMERMTPRAAPAQAVAPPNTPALFRQGRSDKARIASKVEPVARPRLYIPPPPRGRIYLYSLPMGSPVRP